MSPAPTPSPTAAPPGPGTKPGPGPGPGPLGKARGLEWVKTREGKITLGAGAVLVVVVLALRRGAGASGAGGFSADELQTGPDGTLQDRLDQIGMRGGTLEEWIQATTGLSGQVERLTDIIEDQDKVGTPAAPGPGLAELQKRKTSYATKLTALETWRAALNRNRLAFLQRGQKTQAASVHREIDKVTHSIGLARKSLGIVNAQIAKRQQATTGS